VIRPPNAPVILPSAGPSPSPSPSASATFTPGGRP
jgi:hypothetical protein